MPSLFFSFVVESLIIKLLKKGGSMLLLSVFGGSSRVLRRRGHEGLFSVLPFP